MTDFPRNLRHRFPVRWPPIFLLLLGALLRIGPLTQNRLHPDEALFATLARLIVNGRDPWLSQTPLLVDKPPLAYYTVAAFFSVMGASELTARLPSLLASMLCIALVYRLSYQFWGRPTGAIVSMVVMTFSPFAILFAPTVFADYLMTTAILASILAVASGRLGWGGFWLGLSIAYKQNALFMMPLVALIAIIHSLMSQNQRLLLARWLSLLGSLFLCVAASIAWDAMRRPAPSFWVAAAAANNPGRLARSAEVLSRAAGWLNWLQYVTTNRAIDFILILLAVVGIAVTINRRSNRRGSALMLAITAFLIFYLVTQWLVAFPILDRYLLPTIPLFALLAGYCGGLALSWLNTLSPRFNSNNWGKAIGVLAFISMLAPALVASQSGYPVGGDHGAYDGINNITNWLAHQPYGTVVYAHDLDWHVRYYLFDAYVFPVYLDTPQQFTSDLRTFGSDGPPRYLLLSMSEPADELRSAAATARFRLVPVLSPVGRLGQPTMTLYRLDP